MGEAGLDLLITEVVSRRPYPLEFVDLELLQSHWVANVGGLVKAVRTFAPLLRAAHGRILVNGTIGGRLTLPFSGPLSATGHAIKGVSGALRQELRPWSIDVILVELASVRAGDGFEDFATGALAGGTHDLRILYGSRYARITQGAIAQEENSTSPAAVGKALKDIALARRPRSSYVVGRRKHLLSLLSRLPAPAQDLIKRRMLG